jgi:HAD superfamily hydrolase (TIGR01509 family)
MAREKTAYITDFDDTLVHTDARVIVIDKDGNKRTISPAEYASYDKQPGDTFDFAEFEQLKNPRPIKRFVNLLKNVIQNKKADKVAVLTARGHTKPIAQFLKSQGITSGVTIAALGNSDPIAKANYIEKHIKDGYTRVVFVDDAPKNVKAVDTLKAKYPDVKLVVHQAKEAEEKKTGESPTNQARLKDLLKHRIKNPLTGNDIYVKSALGYAPDSSVRKTAVSYIQKNMR